jgi:hypothetical protein
VVHLELPWPRHLGHQLRPDPERTTLVWDAMVSRKADGVAIALFRRTQALLSTKRN